MHLYYFSLDTCILSLGRPLNNNRGILFCLHDRRQNEREREREGRRGGEGESENANNTAWILNEVRARLIFGRQFELLLWKAVNNKQSHLRDL